MAEYVRRKRPPASHPYWARLHDRAHPPSVVTPVATLGAVGMVLGLYGGLMEPMPAAKAVKTAATVAAGAAGVIFATSVPVLLFDVTRGGPGRDRWPAALFGGVAVALALFMAMLVPLTTLLLWYSICSGLGPWLGLLTGLATGAGPGAIVAWVVYHRWQDRQKQWPRWERMRAPRAVSLLPAPATANPAPLPDASPANPEGQRAAE